MRKADSTHEIGECPVCPQLFPWTMYEDSATSRLTAHVRVQWLRFPGAKKLLRESLSDGKSGIGAHVMWFSKPDVNRLIQRRDLNGLLKAMVYDKRDSTGGYSSEALKLQNSAFKGLLSVIGPSDAGFVPALVRLMDERPREHACCAQLLAKIGSALAIEALIARIAIVSDWDLQTFATVLGDLGDKRAVEPIMEALKRGINSSTSRASLAATLGKLGDHRAVGILKECLENKQVITNELEVQGLHDAAREALISLGAMEDPPEARLGRFREQMARFVAGKEDGFKLWKTAADLGAFAIPELRDRLKSDINGPYGRAAVIALHDVPPELALPLIEFALKTSSYGATHHFAAEYLDRHPTEKAKEIAKMYLPAESDASARRFLESTLAK